MDALKAALWTALWTFVGIFCLSSLGFIMDVQSWASSAHRGAFPSVEPIAKGLAAAVTAAFVGLLNFGYRFAQSKGVPLPGNAPAYVPSAIDVNSTLIKAVAAAPEHVQAQVAALVVPDARGMAADMTAVAPEGFLKGDAKS